ncbi:heavy metal translocating P-type ATPase [Spirochaeta dissipatitropha]
MNEQRNPVCPVAEQDRCCLITLHKVLHSQDNIQAMKWDTRTLELEISYQDPGREAADFEHAVENLTHHLTERSATCKDRDQVKFKRGCGICLQQLQRKTRAENQNEGCKAENCEALNVLQDKGIKLNRGVMIVEKPSDGKDRSPWLGRRIKIQQAVETAQGPETLHETRKAGIPEVIARLLKQNVEAIFVFLTLLTMSIGQLSATANPLLSNSMFLAAYLCGGYFGLRASLDSLKNKRIDIDLLMVLAALGAAGVGSPFEGALLLFLFSLSNVLQDYALDRTRSAIQALARLRPDTALVLDTIDSQQGRKTAVEDIPIGTLLQIKPGDRIPLDGKIVRGASSIDQSSITGESLPVEKKQDDTVLAGTINQDGEFVLQSSKTSQESTIARVITLVEEAREQQARTERFLETFEQYYAILVIAATFAAALVPPLLFGREWTLSVYQAITLMVAASPCALIISTPASILSAIGNAARKGILFKGGVHVEQAALIRAIAFDKTGTLTEGKPKVAEVISFSDWSEPEILAAAAGLESKSEHVIAVSIVEEARKRNLDFQSPVNFRSEAGIGVSADYENKRLSIGSPSLLKDTEHIDGLEERIAELQSQSKTVVILAEERRKKLFCLGIISLNDRLRPGVKSVILQLRQTGIQHIAMLTGDNQTAAQAIAAECGIDVVFPELLPEHKLDAIRKMEKDYGPTAMIGDGVNDAPALAGARLGIAMGAAGTDVALETADIVLLSDDLEKIPYLIALSRKTRQTLISNISIALALITMMIIGIYTIDLPLPLAVIGHEGGTVLVSLNGLRLLMFRNKLPKERKKDRS